MSKPNKHFELKVQELDMQQLQQTHFKQALANNITASKKPKKPSSQPLDFEYYQQFASEALAETVKQVANAKGVLQSLLKDDEQIQLEILAESLYLTHLKENKKRVYSLKLAAKHLLLNNRDASLLESEHFEKLFDRIVHHQPTLPCFSLVDPKVGN